MQNVVSCLRKRIVRPERQRLGRFVRDEALDTFRSGAPDVGVAGASVVCGDQVAQAIVKVGGSSADETLNDRLFHADVIADTGLRLQVGIGAKECREGLE